MLKKLILTFISLICIGFSAKCQCIANAGNDTLICASITYFQEYFIGGSPTATGPNGGYTYQWETYYVSDGWVLTASDFLNDPTAANPHFISSFDSLTFYLTVTDALGSICKDTVQFWVAPYTTSLGEIYKFINQGDTVDLTQTYGGGGTFPYTNPQWSPNYNIINSDSLVATVFPDTSTRYYLSQIDSFGCPTSSSVYVWVIPNSTNETFEPNSKIRVFPSFAETNIQVFHEYHNTMLRLCIFDLSAVLVKEEKILEQESSIFIGDLKQGLYYVQIISPQNKSIFSTAIFKK